MFTINWNYFCHARKTGPHSLIVHVLVTNLKMGHFQQTQIKQQTKIFENPFMEMCLVLNVNKEYIF